MLPRSLAPALIALVALPCTWGCSRPTRSEQGLVTHQRRDPLVMGPASIEPGAIAAIFPTVGRYAVSGRQSLIGVRLAVETLNRAGGVGGRPLRLAEYRTGSYFVDARQAASDAVRDGALAIVGSNSSELSQAVAEESDAHGVLQITNVSTAADLTWDPKVGRVHPFVFRMCASDSVIGALLADFARDRLAARRVAVLYEVGRTYSARLANAFLQRFSDPGAGRLTMEAHYLALETDFRPQLRLIKEFRPDVVFMPGSFPDATLMAVQARSLDLHATFLGGDAWSSPLLFQRGTPPGEAYYVELCSPDPAFDRLYAPVLGAEPSGCRAVLAYDAMRVIAAGLEKLGPLSERALHGEGLAETRRRLREVVARSETEGITGRVRFDERGNRRQGVVLYAVEPTPHGPPRSLVRGWLEEP
jgi:branched-chain amino acid transport system substrate-binding protein